MKSELAWVKFVKTGSVKNYLQYCRVKKIESLQEINYASKDNDRRYSYKRNEYR